MITKQYAPLFKGEKSSSREAASVTIDDRYTWIALVDRLSGGDITKHNEIYQKNYIECLNLLAFWRELDNYKKEMYK
jgi:hypothetical protein